MVKIAVDLDQVVYDIWTPMMEIRNHRFPDRPELNWNTWTTYWMREYEVSSKEEEDFILEQLVKQKIFRTVNLIPYARESILVLAQTHEPVFVTAREKFYKKARQDTQFALARDGLSQFQVVFNYEKGEVAKEHDFAFAIDDHPKHILEYLKLGIPTYLFDYPYNRDNRPEDDNLTIIQGFEQKNWWFNLMKTLAKNKVL